MHVVELIQKKRDNLKLTQEEISYFIDNYVDGAIHDYQMSAFLMATCLNGMSDEETSWLTNAMLCSGEVVSHRTNAPIIDKHSTGGVGDKITIPLAPAMAALGVAVPSIAGRGLGHTGGTLDKLEAIPGFRCNLSIEEYKDQINKIGCVITGQTKEIAPADKKIYALRDVTGTVPSIPLISASIMSKKLAEGLDGLVLDVKFGSGAFMKDFIDAKRLAQSMVAIGSHMGKKISAHLTNMDQPLGVMLGNGLEIVESIDILQGRGPEDAVLLTVELGADMLMLANLAQNMEDARQKVRHVLSSGAAFDKFVAMCAAQGGDVRFVHEPEKLYTAPHTTTIESKNTGHIKKLDCLAFGMAINVLGGGRSTVNEAIHPGVGIKMLAKVGDFVEVGQPICLLYTHDKGVLDACRRITEAIEVDHAPIIKTPLCREKIVSL